ncbi:MAG TPA: protein kinase [Ktedonobacterales bacterium]|nr:protein kinase [Ktedonobacterales bacterium]
MADRSGERIGSYRLIRLLGEGGFAQVYLAEHRLLHIWTAIKVLQTRLVQPDELQTFLKEAQLVAHLVHPHIVRVLDFGVADGTPFLVLEYASQGSLRQRHPRGTQLSPEAALPYVLQVAKALQFAHDQGVIHRDIKPENLLLNAQRQVVLADFGIAAIVQSSYTLHEQALLGTAAYMAPEQFQGHPLPASDQYALGVVCYEWLTGTLPFKGSLAELAGQHLSTHPPPLRARVPGFPPALEQSVLRALAKSPGKRFRSVQDFARAFEQGCQSIASIRPSAAPPNTDRTPSPVVPTEHVPTGRLPRGVSGTTSVQPTQLASSEQRPARASPSAKKAAALPPTSPSPEALSRSLPTGLEMPHPPPVQQKQGLSRRTILKGIVAAGAVGGAATCGGLAVLHRIEMLHDQAAAALYTYTGHTDVVTAVAWSPDGKHLASASKDHTVQVWEALTGKHALIYRGHTATVQAISWSPDGRYLASASHDMTVQVWEAATGQQQFVYRGHHGAVQAVAWSPAGQSIASAGWAGDATVQVWKVADQGKTAQTYAFHLFWQYALSWAPNGAFFVSGGVGNVAVIFNGAAEPVGKLDTGQHLSSLLAVAWSPDGAHIADGGTARQVLVWTVSTGQPTFRFTGHASFIKGVAWAPDGKHIASCSDDTTVQIWVPSSSGSSSTSLYRFPGHTQAVNTVAWSPNGQFLASGSDDNTVQVWQP